jgi:hypothetical protein
MILTLKNIEWDTDNQRILDTLPETQIWILNENDITDFDGVEEQSQLRIGDVEQMVRSYKERIEEEFNNDINDFDILLSW